MGLAVLEELDSFCSPQNKEHVVVEQRLNFGIGVMACNGRIKIFSTYSQSVSMVVLGSFG